jgi:ABC-type iron transport system FetAB ATPase subunit
MKAKLETVKDNLIFAFGETHTLNGRENINETIDIVEELIRSADALTKSIQNLSQND